MFQVDPPDRQGRRDRSLACAAALGSGALAWAIDLFTRGPLGAWRLALVVPIGIYAVYTGLVAGLFLTFEFAAKATDPHASRRLRLVARHLGNGALGLFFGGITLVGVVLSYPQPRPWWFSAVWCGAAVAVGVTSGILRRRRRRIDVQRAEAEGHQREETT